MQYDWLGNCGNLSQLHHSGRPNMSSTVAKDPEEALVYPLPLGTHLHTKVLLRATSMLEPLYLTTVPTVQTHLHNTLHLRPRFDLGTYKMLLLP